MTRLEAYKILFPEDTLDKDGYPTTLPCSFGPCGYPVEIACDDCNCEETFWDKEVEFKFVKEVKEL